MFAGKREDTDQLFIILYPDPRYQDCGSAIFADPDITI